MGINSFTYVPPIRRRALPAPLDYELIDAATELFDAGSYLESVHKVFAHILPSARAPVDLAKEKASFIQGSSRVFAHADDGIFFLSVPVVRLPSGGGAIAALRYILSSINSSGQLYQARLRGEDVHLEFSEKLSGLHPQKLLEVLRRMPVEADQHDDWMISQFQATALDRAAIEPLNADEIARADQVWRSHWSDVEELLKEAHRKRSMFFLNELTSFAVSRIRFAVPLGGSLAPRFLQSANTFNDTDVDPMKREAVLGKCAKEMKAISSDELAKNLGHTEYAISPLADGTPGRISGFFEPGDDYMEGLDRARTGGQAIDAALALTGTYYYLLANYAWSTEISEELKNGLLASSGKPWREAANILFAHAKSVAEKYGGEDEDDDDDEDEDEDEDEEEGDDDDEDEVDEEEGADKDDEEAGQ